MAVGPQSGLETLGDPPTETTAASDTDANTSTDATADATADETADATGGDPIACARRTGDGDVAWSLRCGGPTLDVDAGVAVDAAGDIYVGLNVLDLDGSAPFLIDDLVVTPGDHYDFVIAKLDGEGEGSVAVIGSFDDAIDLGEGPITATGGDDSAVHTQWRGRALTSATCRSPSRSATRS